MGFGFDAIIWIILIVLSSSIPICTLCIYIFVKMRGRRMVILPYDIEWIWHCLLLNAESQSVEQIDFQMDYGLQQRNEFDANNERERECLHEGKVRKINHQRIGLCAQ